MLDVLPRHRYAVTDVDIRHLRVLRKAVRLEMFADSRNAFLVLLAALDRAA
jgi:hypothetical protein